MKNTIDEMKVYQKGLEEDILKSDEKNNVEQIMQERVEEEKMKLKSFENQVELEKQELLNKVDEKLQVI